MSEQYQVKKLTSGWRSSEAEFLDALMEMEPSTILDFALSSCEVQADLNSEDKVKFQSWYEVVETLRVLLDTARELEK